MENTALPEEKHHRQDDKRTWIFVLKQAWNDNPHRTDYPEHGITFRILGKAESTLNDQIRKLETENQHYEERILTLEEENVNFQKRNNRLDEQNLTLGARISEYPAQLAAKIDEIALLNSIVDKLGKELNLCKNNNFLDLKINDIRNKKAVLNRELAEYNKLLTNVREVSLAYEVAKETVSLRDENVDDDPDETSAIQSNTSDTPVTIRISNMRLFRAFGFMKRRYERLKERVEGPDDSQMEVARKEFKDEILKLKEALKIQVTKNKEQDKLISQAFDLWFTESAAQPGTTKLVPIHIKSERYTAILRKRELKKLYQEIEDLKAALRLECEKALRVTRNA